GHLATHNHRIEGLGEQTRLHVFASGGGDHIGAGTGEHVALELEHRFLFLDQQHPALDGAFAFWWSYRDHFLHDSDRRRDRQPYFHHCAAFGSVMRRDVATVFLHDSVADAKPSPVPFPTFLVV